MITCYAIAMDYRMCTNVTKYTRNNLYQPHSQALCSGFCLAALNFFFSVPGFLFRILSGNQAKSKHATLLIGRKIQSCETKFGTESLGKKSKAARQNPEQRAWEQKSKAARQNPEQRAWEKIQSCETKSGAEEPGNKAELIPTHWDQGVFK